MRLNGSFTRPAHRFARIAGGFIRPSTRSQYFAVARQRIGTSVASGPLETCAACESPAAALLTVTDATAAARGLAKRKTFHMRVCRVCGHVGNPENVRDYRTFEKVTDLPDRERIGTPERPGREFYMGGMAVDIIGREHVDVLVFGAGRSLDNQHIATLPQVRHVAIADVMRLRDDAEFIDANVPASRRFDIVIASEVVEHFIEPRKDFAHLFSYVEPDGLLVCSTNIYDGGNLSTQRYVFMGGHTSYYSAGSVERLAKANGFMLDIRIPLVATGYVGPRKRYLLLSQSTSVMAGVARYFSTRRYAPSESPTADRELAAARRARA